MLIPVSNEVKTKLDLAAVGTAGFAFFKAIPWPELAACAAFFYTVLRIVEFLWAWFKQGKKAWRPIASISKAVALMKKKTEMSGRIGAASSRNWRAPCVLG
jgi:hypothetical protein